MARVVDEIIKPNQIYNDGHRFKNHLFFIPFQLDLRVDFEFIVVAHVFGNFAVKVMVAFLVMY